MMSTTGRFERSTCALGAVVIAASISGCGTTPPNTGRHDPTAPQAQALTVSAVTSSEVPATFEAGGVVRAQTTAALSARVLAPVVGVHVRTGDGVKRGATLVTLDSRELAAHAARGKASLLAAEQAARAAEAQIQAAEAGLRLARATHDRISRLHEQKSATTHERDQALEGLRAAEAQVSGAQAQRAAALAARDAALASAEASDVGLSYTTITAPFDGVVATRSVDPGAMAAPGMTLLVLEQRGAARLEATLDEARAGTVTMGQPVEVNINGTNSSWHSATVTELGRLDAASHSFLVKIDLPSTLSPRSGAFGRARFIGSPRRALTVPVSSVVRRGQLALVFVVGPNRLARLRPVSQGPAGGDRVEILAGLTERDWVVTAPPAELRDGTPITEASEPTGRRQ